MSCIFYLLGATVTYQVTTERVVESRLGPRQFQVVFAQRYEKNAGVGTVVAMMLPYAAVSYVVWTALMVLWYLLAIPLGV